MVGGDDVRVSLDHLGCERVFVREGCWVRDGSVHRLLVGRDGGREGRLDGRLDVRRHGSVAVVR